MRKLFKIAAAVILAVLLIITYSEEINYLLLLQASVPKVKTTLKPRNHCLGKDSLPLIHYFLQDDNDPAKIVAVMDKSHRLIHKRYTVKKNRDTILNEDSNWYQNAVMNTCYYWKSDNFGKTWNKTDSSVFEEWNIRDSVVHKFSYNVGIYDTDSTYYYSILKMAQGDSVFHKTHKLNDTTIIRGKEYVLNQKELVCYINQKELDAEKNTSISSFSNWAWINQQTYYAVNDEGILIGACNENGKPGKEIFWEWSHRNWENDSSYEASYPSNEIINYVDWFTDEIIGRTFEERDSLRQEYREKALLYRKFIYLHQHDTLHFILPSYKGGLWYGQVPLHRPITLRILLYWFVKYHLVLVLVAIYLFGITKGYLKSKR